MLKKMVAAVVVTAAFGGCATYSPVPEGYTGPTASVADSGRQEDGTKAQLFAMTNIDSHRVMNAFWASSSASYGRGFALSMSIPERKVPAKPMNVTLRGSHATAAPIHAIASQMAGTFFSVEGIVAFDPKPNGRYVVKGELKKGASSVWIEDAETGQPATEKVVEKLP